MAETNIFPASESRQLDKKPASKHFRKLQNSEVLTGTVISKSANLRLVPDTSPSRFFGRVPPRKPKNEDRRPREHLTEVEVEALAKAADKRGRYGHRDRTMIMVCFRHGLRVGELVSQRWDQIKHDEALIERKESMAQQSARRGRDNQGFPLCFEHAMGDLDPVRELPYRPAAVFLPHQRPDRWQHPTTRSNDPNVFPCLEGGVHRWKPDTSGKLRPSAA